MHFKRLWMPILRYFTFLVHFLWSSGTLGRYLEIFGELDTWKFDCGMPDLQVLTLLVSLGFGTWKRRKKLKVNQKKTAVLQQHAFSFSVCYLVLVAIQLLVTFFRFLFSLKLFRHCPVLIPQPYKTQSQYPVLVIGDGEQSFSTFFSKPALPKLDIRPASREDKANTSSSTW